MRAALRPPSASRPQVSDASLHCALQLFFSLVTTMGTSNALFVDKILCALEEMLGALPLFSLSERSPLRPAHLTESVLEDLHGFLVSLAGDLGIGPPSPVRCRAVKLLLTLALGRGALRYVLEVVRMLLAAGASPLWADVRIAVLPLLAQLQQVCRTPPGVAPALQSPGRPVAPSTLPTDPPPPLNPRLCFSGSITLGGKGGLGGSHKGSLLQI